ncbi:ABC transporter ATP-binding protein [Marinitenerispora sediminis]|uniref:Oligopeptide ABC transporter ATP-binding protein n=1 Tax=Marinitenerispora sediminis TaxID=1931232 RepID=A0A368TBX4_9ACTN|nr:ATP-binding cassette domain-containing protein [Marinitenerispora sediminis]RCV50098.1 oligopeptide ABC transporter ATP-binding protein [Marinitenerispora sediminis]RCV54467.1 oligopeptide ABC transporter ATP-binding protein [Marinitenerispora sediminis]RCV62476.1 oligopeptide ABC transporter ATP-binding protein [Marinitenerispora sediminis]
MLELDSVSKVFPRGAFGRSGVTAVRDVSFAVRPGEVVSLIGESGSGKSTIGRMVLRLASVTRGRITFDGADIAGLTRTRQLREYHRRVQGVFQDPFSSCNPVFPADRVLDAVRRGYFPDVGAAEWRDRVDAALEVVRLDPAQVRGRYPHQLSGGQLQRLLIARALLLDIRLLVADEVISMLDASTRIDVLNLLADLRARGLGILFVTHDLALGNYVSDTTVILRRGRVVETGATATVFADPLHPYTRRLLASVPRLRRRWSDLPDEPAGARPCPYHERYPRGAAAGPPLLAVADDHHVGCFADDGKPC